MKISTDASANLELCFSGSIEDLWLRLKNRYANVSCIFVGGSFIQGKRDRDIDVIVLVDDIVSPIHEQWFEDSTLMDVYVHDFDTLMSAFKGESLKKVGALTNLIINSEHFPPANISATHVRAAASQIFNTSPQPPNKEQLRYIICSTIRELEVDRPQSEIRAIAMQSNFIISKFYLPAAGIWGAASEKYADRLLKEHFPGFHNNLQQAYSDVFVRNDVRALKELLFNWQADLGDSPVFPRKKTFPQHPRQSQA